MRRPSLSAVHALPSAAFCALGLGALICLMERAPHTLALLDGFASSAVQPLQTFRGVEIFIAITTLGSVTGILVVGVGAILLLRTHWRMVLGVLIALAGSSASALWLKMLIARARPPGLPWIAPEQSYSFPSGHATSTMALYGFLAILWYRRATTRIGKILAILLPVSIILLVGFSRVVLSVHFFSDVLAGYLVGAFWVAFSFWLVHRKHNSELL